MLSMYLIIDYCISVVILKENTVDVNAETKKSFTFREVYNLTQKVGSGLIRKGFKRGDTLCIYSTNQPEYIITLFAVIAIGGKVTTANPSYTVDELKRQLEVSGSEYIVCSADSAAKAAQAVSQLSAIKSIYVFGETEGCTPFSVLTEDDGMAFQMVTDFDPNEEIAFLPFSSGTTGLPKGVKLTHRNIVANLCQMNHPDVLKLGKDDVCMGVLPFYHIFGLVLIALHSVICGSTVVTVSHFEPHVFLKAIEEYKVTLLPLVPYLTVFLTQSPLVAEYELDSLGTIISGASALSDEQSEALISRLPNINLRQEEILPESYKHIKGLPDPVMGFIQPVFDSLSSTELLGKCLHGKSQNTNECLNKLIWDRCNKEYFVENATCCAVSHFNDGYGMTETSPVCHMAPVNDPKPGSVGVLLPNTECKIIDLETMESVDVNELGEMYIRGPQVMKGYLNNDQATKETIDEDGWLLSGDVGYRDEEGHFYIVDRKKDMIKYRGFQVSPTELEGVLLMHKGVQDCGVIGMPDPQSGELTVAFIVRKEDATNLTVEEITEYIADQVAPHKQLTGGVRFVGQIPRNPSGKILRKELKNFLLAELEQRY
ncbi:4-coumarate--CoA ligase-like 9 [Nymphon striatum]|nr:4-coumarate--CoA ligase-like 9 [Nymphon striatum]